MFLLYGKRILKDLHKYVSFQTTEDIHDVFMEANEFTTTLHWIALPNN